MAGGNLLIITAIGVQRTRERFEPMLQAVVESGDFLAPHAFASKEVVLTDHLDLAVARLEQHFQTVANPLAIVISDQIVECGGIVAPDASRAPNLEAMEKLDPHYLAPHGTIGITSDGKRVANIDRVLSEQLTSADRLRKSVELVADRVVYLQRPAPRTSVKPFRIRRINDELEMQEYYRLRHRVYRMMGYMSTQKEDVPSEMEIDGCDCAALHIGAFEIQSGFESLVGTVRLVFMDSDNEFAICRGCYWTSNLLQHDAQLRVLVGREQLPNRLPIFHSQDLNEELHYALENNLKCAELSRVIVHPDYRGARLSAQLVKFTVQEATDAKIDLLYLECLDVHESLYAQLGFKTIPNTHGVVVGVGRTMIAMVLDLRH